MRHFDFVEIGTSYFESAGEQPFKNGLSVEPVAEYLYRLPELPGRVKVNAAALAEEDMPPTRSVDLHLVPEATIKALDLGYWLAGCNSINTPHPLHTRYMNPDSHFLAKRPEKLTCASMDLVSLGLVETRKVPAVTYAELVAGHGVASVGLLKIDIEGYDLVLLGSILDYCAASSHPLPTHLMVEQGSLTPRREQVAMRKRLTGLGYALVSDGNDLIMERGGR
jgi:hypothetical protein